MPTESETPSAAAGAAGAGTVPHDVRLDDAGHVAESLACRGCGYDLKGMTVGGVCPECANPVERSLRGDLLQFCDPAWLERLGQGLLLIFFGIVGGTMLQIGIMIAAAVAGAIAATTGGASAMTIVMVVGGLAMAIVALVNIIGAWLATTQDPGRVETEPPLSLRAVARFAIMATLISAPMQMLMGQSGVFTGGGGSGGGTGLRALDVMIMAIGVGTAVVALVGWVAFYAYVRQVVLRVPLAKLAWQVRVIMWGYASSTALSILFGIVTMVLLATGRLVMTGANMTGRMQVIAVGVSFGSCFSMMAFMVFEIWAAVLFLVLRKRFTAMAAAGREQA